MPDTQDNKDLAELLDELIKDKNFKVALNTLHDVRNTFSRYNEYMEKIGLLIK